MLALIQWVFDQVRSWISPIAIVADWEEAIVLRLGRYHRTLKPGPHWVMPKVETVIRKAVKPDTLDLPTQCVTLRDGTPWTFSVSLIFEVVDLRQAYVMRMDLTESLTAVAMLHCARVVRRWENKDEALRRHRALEGSLLRTLQGAGSEWGVNVMDAGLTHSSTTRGHTLYQIT